MRIKGVNGELGWFIFLVSLSFKEVSPFVTFSLGRKSNQKVQGKREAPPLCLANAQESSH
jgi:hypothetical protein